MNYELAKQLRDAGFRQGIGMDGEHHECPHRLGDPPSQMLHGIDCPDWVYYPTLSELIEACGEHLVSLSRQSDGRWFAYSRTEDEHGNNLETCFPNIEEAVANLYLALHAKA